MEKIKWEYKVQYMTLSDLTEIGKQNLLNKYGLEGWELTAISDNYYFFKRQLATIIQ